MTISARIMSMLKQLIQAFFGSFGLQISRKKNQSANKYFNTGRLTPLQENSIEIYDKFYGDHEVLDEYYKDVRIKFYQAVAKQLILEEVVLDGKKVLDVGCGVGFLLDEVSKVFNTSSLTGTDFSEEAMKVSRNKFPAMKFFRHDIYDLLPEKYDVIFCTEVLEHLEKPVVGLKNLINALKDNGTLVLTVPDGRIDTSIEHINFWSPESWKVFLERECPNAKVRTTKLMDGSYNFALLRFPAI